MRHLILAVVLTGAGCAAAATPCGPVYEVKPGDTLPGIAEHCGVPAGRLYGLNVIAGPTMLAPGTMLRLEETGAAGGRHEVRAGETLRGIAEANDVTVPALLVANGLDPMPELVPGMELEIPAAGFDGPVAGEGSRETVLTGRLSAGVECPVLTTDEGEVWALTGDIPPEAMGREARVRGTVAEMSFCMQGEGTLSVAEVEVLAGE